MSIFVFDQKKSGLDVPSSIMWSVRYDGGPPLVIEMRVFIARTYTYINVPNYKMFGAEISEIYLGKY